MENHKCSSVLGHLKPLIFSLFQIEKIMVLGVDIGVCTVNECIDDDASY